MSQSMICAFNWTIFVTHLMYNRTQLSLLYTTIGEFNVSKMELLKYTYIKLLCH